MPRLCFNTTGPCHPEKHYMLPAEERLPDLLGWVEQELYFVIHAARQTGKTTAMIAFAKRLRELGYAALYVTFEASRVFPEGWWREHAETLRSRSKASYTEAVAHLAFNGFLQRVVNGGGRVTREYGAGRHRIDMLVEFEGGRHAIELKRVRPKDGAERVRAQGLVQLGGYMDTLGLAEGWLVIFDQRPRLGWKERIWQKDVIAGGRTIHIVGG